MSHRVTAVGGGHGLAASLDALRRLTPDVTAVVSVADDGGSTGRLRDAFHVPAYGDLRKAILALAAPDSRLAAAMAHRFDEGDLDGHAFGNLLIAAMAQVGGDLVAALDEIVALTGGVGRVLPAVSDWVVLHGCTSGGDVVVGQARLCVTEHLRTVSVEPAEPDVPKETADALATADLIVLGPGSLYTSVLAAAVAPAVLRGIQDSPAPLVYVCNLRPQRAESSGYSVADHVDALRRHGLEPDVVLYDGDQIGDAERVPGATPASLARSSGLAHDPAKLAAAFESLDVWT
jgi:uncharacterized cofD-like protein